MLFNQPEIILWDTEFTSWEGCMPRNFDLKKNQFIEIIQLGAIRVDTQSYDIKAEIMMHVKPVLNPKLSDHIVNLTGITQEDADNGLDLLDALEQFIKFKGNLQCFSYKYDFGILAGNIFLRGLDIAESWGTALHATEYFDVRDIFFANDIPAHKYSSGSISKYFGLETEKKHDALCDAKSIARSLKALQDSKCRHGND